MIARVRRTLYSAVCVQRRVCVREKERERECFIFILDYFKYNIINVMI